MEDQSDWEKPFPERYLECADAIARLEHWLMVVGLSGSKNFAALKNDFILHGAATFNDINRSK